MKLLGWWLILVGIIRLAAVWYGYSAVRVLNLIIFSKTTVTEVHGRSVGVWTMVTCTLCFLCAFNLENKPLYIATLLTFIYALAHFLTEFLFYHTMAIGNITLFSFIAGTSIAWMLLQWNSHGPVKARNQ